MTKRNAVDGEMTAEPSAALDLYATGVEGDPGVVVHPDDARPGGGRPAGGPGRFGRSRTGTAALPGTDPDRDLVLVGDDDPAQPHTNVSVTLAGA